MRSSKLFHDYYIASLTTTICKTLNHVRAYGVLVKCSLMCVPCISMNEDKSVFWVLFQQRKSYSVSFDRLYHLYPFIYPKYKHNKSLKLNQCRIFHLKISFPALSVAQKWQNSIFRSSNRVRFNENWPFFHRRIWTKSVKLAKNDLIIDLKLALKSKIRIGFRLEPNYGKMSGFPIILNRLRRHLIKWSLNLNYDRLNWNRLLITWLSLWG